MTVNIFVDLLNRWFCLAPTVPNQVNYFCNQNTTLETQFIQAPNSEIQNILEKFTPIEIYGYYYGGYREAYQHRILCGIVNSKEEAFSKVLQATNMVAIEDLITYNSNDFHNSIELQNFLKQYLKSNTRYNIGFWDIGYTYEIGKTPDDDWIGTSSICEFEYNP